MWNRKSQKEIRDDSVISTISLNIDVYILDSGKSDVNQTKKRLNYAMRTPYLHTVDLSPETTE